MHSSLIHKHSCVFYVKHHKNLLLLAAYFRSYLIFEKNICISDLFTTIACDICYHARKINPFTRKGHFHNSGNFGLSQGKFDSFKQVRGR